MMSQLTFAALLIVTVSVTQALVNLAVPNLPQQHAPGSRSSPQCDDTKMQQCLAHYADDIGLTSFPSDATQFSDFINNLAMTKKGYIQLCTATKALVYCLGPMEDSCMSAQHIQTLGVDAQNAVVYHTVYIQLKFQCGPAFKIFLQNYDCIQATTKAQNSTLLTCRNTYIANITKDPSGLCQYSQDFADCYASVYQVCGKDVAKVLCQSIVLSLEDSLPQCQLSCSYSRTGIAKLHGHKKKATLQEMLDYNREMIGGIIYRGKQAKLNQKPKNH